MRNGQKNEMLFVLSILKNPEIEFNANSLAKAIGLSAMGSLKIAKKLEKENVLLSRKIGRTNVYKINPKNAYVRQYVKFILKKEIEIAKPYIKRWIRELEKIKNADGIILFGSVIKKGEEAEDIDALIIANNKNFEKVKKEVENINLVNEKKIHPLYQTHMDLEKNIREGNKVVLNAVKGIIVSGEDFILEVLQK